MRKVEETAWGMVVLKDGCRLSMLELDLFYVQVVLAASYLSRGSLREWHRENNLRKINVTAHDISTLLILYLLKSFHNTNYVYLSHTGI